MDAIIGGLLGAIARFAPEVLKFFDRKGERQHELALGNQSLEAAKVAGANKLQSETVTTESAQVVSALEAIKQAYAGQPTGVKWVDSANALVRPWITFVIFHTWFAVKVAAFVQLTTHGIDWSVALQTMWTGDDVAMLAGVTNFYFLGRVFDKKK